MRRISNIIKFIQEQRTERRQELQLEIRHQVERKDICNFEPGTFFIIKLKLQNSIYSSECVKYKYSLKNNDKANISITATTGMELNIVITLETFPFFFKLNIQCIFLGMEGMQHRLEFGNIQIRHLCKKSSIFQRNSPYFRVFAIFLRAISSDYYFVDKLLHCIGQ